MNKICKADMIFWREAVVYYRNLRKALRIAGDQKKAEETRQVLKESRIWQRFVEKAVLGVILLACLFATGCQTFKGATGDTAWMLQKLSDNVQVDK